MVMLEKLIEIIEEAEEHATDVCIFYDSCEDCPGRKYGNDCRDYLKADHLIANDVVLVVRCKDCKHFTEGMAIGMCKRISDKPIMPMTYNNYCGFAERKDNG